MQMKPDYENKNTIDLIVMGAKRASCMCAGRTVQQLVHVMTLGGSSILSCMQTAVDCGGFLSKIGCTPASGA
jgi:hypothetical protein